MGGYLYLHPIPRLKEYKTNTYKFTFLFSPELLLKNHKKDEKQFRVNKPAIQIIMLLNGLKTYDEIIKALSVEYKESFDVIEEKVAPFLVQLTEQYGYSIKEQENPELQEIVFMRYNNVYPTVASIELTSACNIRCRHCYGEYGTSRTKHLELPDIYFILESLGEIEVNILELTGGDPSVYPYCSDTIEKAFEVGISTVMILTNGIYFSDKLVETLVKYKDRIFLQIDVHSLRDDYYDWFTDSKGNLPKVKNNIDMLIGKGIRVRVCSIITPGNVNEMAEIGEWAYEHGALSYAPSIITALGRAKLSDKTLFFQDVDSLFEFKRQHDLVLERHPKFIQEIVNMEEVSRKNCGAICSQVSINVNGDIKLCNMDSSDSFSLLLGNVISEPIKQIFDNNKEFVSEFMEVGLPAVDSEDCKECEEKLFCTNCMLRGFIGAKRRNKTNKTCHWYEKIDPIIKERFVYKIK